MAMQHLGYLSLRTTPSANPYADWQPERPSYETCGHQLLEVVALLEAHIGGPLNVSRLMMLAAMKGQQAPDGGYHYEVAAIRRLKANPGRGCPPHIRDGLMTQLFIVWPNDLPLPKSKEAA